MVHRQSSFSYKSLPCEFFTRCFQLKCCTWVNSQDLYSSHFLSVFCVLQVGHEHLKTTLQGRHSSFRWHDWTEASLVGRGGNWTQISQKVSDLQRLLITKESPELLTKNTHFTLLVDLEWAWGTGSLKDCKCFLFVLRFSKPITKSQRPSRELSIYSPHNEKHKLHFMGFYNFMTGQSLVVFSSDPG